MAGPWTKKDKESFARGMAGGPLPEPTVAAPKEPDLDSVDPSHGEYAATDGNVAAQQKANLADPSRAAALEKMVIARRKFLGK